MLLHFINKHIKNNEGHLKALKKYHIQLQHLTMTKQIKIIKCVNIKNSHILNCLSKDEVVDTMCGINNIINSENIKSEKDS